jgi:tRNA(Ile)-lysidine synthase
MRHTLITHIIDYIYKNQLIKPDSTIIIGLSGGPDSVFLLHVLCQLQDYYNIKLIAAHLDHGWRAESAEDAQFCRNLAAHLSIPIIIEHASQIKLTRKTHSLEEQGRYLRRTFFEQVAQTYQASAIALAHHADDQEETFFIRLLRGATIAGLAGIWPQNGLYIRPLLEVYKADILAYLAEHQISYTHDITNTSDKFLRNKIRNTLLPLLHSIDPRSRINFSKTIKHIQETESFLEQITQHAYRELQIGDNGTSMLNLEKLLQHDQFLIKRILVIWLCDNSVTFTISDKFLHEIIRFLRNKKSNMHSLHTTWRIHKKNQYIIILNQI